MKKKINRLALVGFLASIGTLGVCFYSLGRNGFEIYLVLLIISALSGMIVTGQNIYE